MEMFYYTYQKETTVKKAAQECGSSIYFYDNSSTLLFYGI